MKIICLLDYIHIHIYACMHTHTHTHTFTHTHKYTSQIFIHMQAGGNPNENPYINTDTYEVSLDTRQYLSLNNVTKHSTM
jgi:hypothetical protein